MFGKIAEAQKQAKEIKERLDKITVEGTAADGSIKVTSNGNRVIQQIEIADEWLNPLRKAELEAALLLAVSDALLKADGVSQAEMQHVMGKLMPGLGGLFGK